MARTYPTEVKRFDNMTGASVFGNEFEIEVNLEDNVAALNLHIEGRAAMATVGVSDIGSFLAHPFGALSAIKKASLKVDDESCERFDIDNYSDLIPIAMCAQDKFPYYSWIDVHTIAFEDGETQIYQADITILFGVAKSAGKYTLNLSFLDDDSVDVTLSKGIMTVTELRTPVVADAHWYRFNKNITPGNDAITVKMAKGEVHSNIEMYIHDTTPSTPQTFNNPAVLAVTPDQLFTKFGFGPSSSCPKYFVRSGLGMCHLYGETGWDQVGGAAQAIQTETNEEIYARILNYPMDSYGAPEMYLRIDDSARDYNFTGDSLKLWAMRHTLMPLGKSVIVQEEVQVQQQEADFQESEQTVVDEQNNEALQTTRENSAVVEDSSTENVTNGTDTPTEPLAGEPDPRTMTTEALLEEGGTLFKKIGQDLKLTDQQKATLRIRLQRIAAELGSRGTNPPKEWATV